MIENLWWLDVCNGVMGMIKGDECLDSLLLSDAYSIIYFCLSDSIELLVKYGDNLRNNDENTVIPHLLNIF